MAYSANLNTFKIKLLYHIDVKVVGYKEALLIDLKHCTQSDTPRDIEQIAPTV